MVSLVSYFNMIKPDFMPARTPAARTATA
jgi:hypothetical protein